MPAELCKHSFAAANVHLVAKIFAVLNHTDKCMPSPGGNIFYKVTIASEVTSGVFGEKRLTARLFALSTDKKRFSLFSPLIFLTHAETYGEKANEENNYSATNLARNCYY